MSLQDTTPEGRMWAALSYGAVFFGLPLGVIPLVQRTDAFALHHAKQALGVQGATLLLYAVGFAMMFALFFVTCGLSNFLAIPLLGLLLMWPLLQGLHGVMLAMNGDWSAPALSFGIGDAVLSHVTVVPPSPPPGGSPAPPPAPPQG